MLQTRVIPCLLLDDNNLVKTVKFKESTYVGDPMNAVTIFNEKEVDEIVILDISATLNNRIPNYDLIEEITSQAFMPLSYGGGITEFDQVRHILSLGVEKVIINSKAFHDEQLLLDVVRVFGSQSLIIALDVKKSLFGKYELRTHSGSKKASMSLEKALRYFNDLGVGEIMINMIDRDGMMNGYDLDLIQIVSSKVSVPLIVCGGASSIEDFRLAQDAGANAVAAGSFFVFHGKHKAVLLTYPNYDELQEVLNF